jgi:uncharacterized DUF497 family protein
MFLSDKIIGFDWDDGNVNKNTKHSVSPSEAEQIFLNEPLLMINDPKHSADEPRYHAMGQTNEQRLLHVSFTIRGNKIRVISARDMHKKERVIYDQKK